MAKRATETFVKSFKDGKRVFHKDEVVPAKFAKDIDDRLLYDDGAKTTRKPAEADD